MQIVKTFKPVFLAVAFTLPQVGFSDEVPPTNGDALYDWLSAGSYKEWVHESDRHPSAGPHPSSVIAYLNKLLDESLSSGAAVHPKGAAAVKELFDDAGELSGWAVSVKTDSDSAAGQGWYWYEMLGTKPDSRVVADGNGVPLCFGCHTPGNDFVLIPHPLK